MKKLLIFLITFFSSLFILTEKSYAYSYENITFNYDSIDFISLYNNYEIVEHIKEIVEEYNTHNFPVMIYFIHDENNANYLERIGFGVDQRTLNSNTNFYINNFLRETTTPFVFMYDEALNTTNKNCYFSYYGTNSDGTQLCRFRTNLTIDSYTQNDLNTFYTNIQKMLTQYVYNQSGIASGNVTPQYTTNITTQSYNIYDQNQYQAYVWSNVDLINKKGIMTGYTNYINNTYFGDDLVPFDDEFITYDTYINSLSPTISFTYNSYSNNNEIYKGVVHIDFSTIDNTTYIYQILKSTNNEWENITPNGIYDVEFYNNGYVSARIIERATGNIIDTNTFNVIGINEIFNIYYSNKYNRDDQGNIISSDISITYYSNNDDNFIYAYEVFTNYNENIYPKVKVNGNTKIVNIGTDSTIIGYIYDISDTNMENPLYTSSFSVNGIINTPKISFESCQHFNSDYIIDHLCPRINYGWYDPNIYKYEYMIGDSEEWVTVNRRYNEVIMYEDNVLSARVTNIRTNELVDFATYYAFGIGTDVSYLKEEDKTFTSWFSRIFEANPFVLIFQKFKDFINTIMPYRIYDYIMGVIITSFILLIFSHIKK